jgi:hypothetical protein
LPVTYVWRPGVGRQVGVGKQHPDLPVRHAKLLGGHLRDDHAESLPHVGGGGADLDRAVLVRLDLGGGFIGRAAAQSGVLVRAGDPPAVRLVALAPAPAEGLIAHRGLHPGADLLQRVEQTDALTENLAGGGRLADAQCVLAAKLDGIHAQFLGQQIHVALDGERRLRDAEPPERAGGWVIGVHHVAVDLRVGHGVGAGGVGRGARHHLVA